MTTQRHEWTPRQAELLAKARERGPWAEDRYGKIRNAEGCCPIEAALGLPAGSSLLGERNLSSDERAYMVSAADASSSPLRPALRAALGMPEAG